MVLSMRTAITIALTLIAASAAQAHSYRIGNLEILHPAIMVPQANSDCTCAHVTITNHGPETEYFLGADIAIASDTRLLHVTSHDRDISAPSEVAIAPGSTLDLHRHEWCLFLRNIPKSLEADVGAYPARLMFRHAGTIDIEFMVDAPHH
jgi:periplasmic copper chaperone A